MKKVVIGVLIFICMFFNMNRVLAGRGCCSHHGGRPIVVVALHQMEAVDLKKLKYQQKQLNIKQ